MTESEAKTPFLVSLGSSAVRIAHGILEDFIAPPLFFHLLLSSWVPRQYLGFPLGRLADLLHRGQSRVVKGFYMGDSHGQPILHGSDTWFGSLRARSDDPGIRLIDEIYLPLCELGPLNL